MYQFHLINADDSAHAPLLASMHHLRWQTFYQELKWSVGLKILNCMEFDEYDHKGATYIVRTNPEGIVDATCRLIPTDQPYMLEQHYPHFIQEEPIPKTHDVWEFTRACASPEARKQSGGTITAQLITAAVEFGMVHGVKNYISLTTDTLYPLLRKIGWDPKLMGPKQATPDDVSYCFKYNVDQTTLDTLRIKNKIPKPLIYDFDPELKNVRELWHDSHIYQRHSLSADANPGRERGFNGHQFSAFVPGISSH